MKLKEKIIYCVFIIFCLLICLGLVYKTAEAKVTDWLLGGTKTVVIFEKTIDSEINRLSEKYDISSSTVRAVAKCESSLYGSANHQNVDKDGVVWSTDWGILQINDYYHEQTMAKLGLDIHNQWDSLEYGFILMKEQGLKPWKASSMCWTPKINLL